MHRLLAALVVASLAAISLAPGAVAPEAGPCDTPGVEETMCDAAATVSQTADPAYLEWLIYCMVHGGPGCGFWCC